MTGVTRCSASLAVFLINLDRATDRLLSMQHKLRRLGFRFERVPAIDGGAIEFPISDFDEFAFRFKHGRLRNPAEVGCYLSHIECAKRLLASNSEFALVLEDDLAFPDDFNELVHAALSQAEKWDILRLSTVSSGRKFKFSRLTRNRSVAVALTREKGSGAYIINRQAAAWFVDELLPMQLPFDLAFDLEFFAGLKSAFVFPIPVDQQLGLPSQIQGEHRRRFHRSRGHYLTVLPYRMFMETARLLTRMSLLLGHLAKERTKPTRYGRQGGGLEGIPPADRQTTRIGEM